MQADGLSFAQTLGGDADRVVAVILEVGVALEVLVVALAISVKDPAVEFDDQLLGVEDDVEFVAVQSDFTRGTLPRSRAGSSSTSAAAERSV